MSDPTTAPLYVPWVRPSRGGPWQRLAGSYPDQRGAIDAALLHLRERGRRGGDVLILPAGERPEYRRR